MLLQDRLNLHTQREGGGGVGDWNGFIIAAFDTCGRTFGHRTGFRLAGVELSKIT